MSCFSERRRRLTSQLSGIPVILANGWERLRNPSNTYNFRGESHVIYLAGKLPAGAFITLNGDDVRVYLEPVSVDDAVWSGPGESWEVLAERHEASIRPLSELGGYIGELGRDQWASLPVQDPKAQAYLTDLLGRSPNFKQYERDRKLAEAMVECRLINDEFSIAELRRAGKLSVEAHFAGVQVVSRHAARVSRRANDERDVLTAMMEVLHWQGAEVSFAPIITIAGERLHQPHIGGSLNSGSLLLVDFGAETENGWAGDITNTWPLCGEFKPEERAVFDTVVAAYNACVSMLKPGRRYLDVHMRAAEVLAEGLKDMGILRGSTAELLERDAHAFFFPHGIGHLMGLDVHDMEDLGDIAGYQKGRVRSKRFGLNCLRLDRDLRAGMALTVEPGIYFIPELLDNPQIRAEYKDCIDWDRVEKYRGVRGIRFERDHLITADGSECLTPGLPANADEVEKLMDAYDWHPIPVLTCIPPANDDENMNDEDFGIIPV
ncbi:aminopeptidase P N-terminal domain-containing protein [bacterium]|nr:aminopeptidase P N-terminal domain-containing protein [bacterium]